jgi:hypothetical protein
MGYDRLKVINRAIAEVGYCEKSRTAYKKNPDILREKTAGAGHDNYTKYGKEMHNIYPAVMDFPAAWCDSFIDWLFYKEYGVATAKNLLGGKFDDYTVASALAYQSKTALNKTPEVGAQIFFTRNGKASGCYHTGLVIAVSADRHTVTTIEGNTSATGADIVANGGCVAKKTRKVTSNTLFGHPCYNDGYGKVNLATTDKPLTTARRFDKAVAGTYAVTATALNMRSGSATNQKILVSIPHGSKVRCYGYYNLNNGEKWLWAAYGAYTGFVHSGWLKKA